MLGIPQHEVDISIHTWLQAFYQYGQSNHTLNMTIWGANKSMEYSQSLLGPNFRTHIRRQCVHTSPLYSQFDRKGLFPFSHKTKWLAQGISSTDDQVVPQHVEGATLLQLTENWRRSLFFPTENNCTVSLNACQTSMGLNWLANGDDQFRSFSYNKMMWMVSVGLKPTDHVVCFLSVYETVKKRCANLKPWHNSLVAVDALSSYQMRT